MDPAPDRIRQDLKTPRAAAVAGIIFSVLLITSMLLVRTSIPKDPLAASHMVSHSERLAVALDLLPFAGISFLWFVGVLRDRLGDLEDRFFSTVFFGSALLFLGMTFTAASIIGGIIRLMNSGSKDLLAPGMYTLGRIQAFQAMHTYAIKMAGVFMISTSTISLQTGIIPRWMAFLGFALALTLLLSVGTFQLMLLVFPLWVLTISIYILIDNFSNASRTVTVLAKEKVTLKS